MNARICFFVLALSSTSALAHEPRLLSALSAIDVVPTPAQLDRLTRDVPAALAAVAVDAALHEYLRERATSLLSFYPTPATAARLEAIANASPPGRVRWMAGYTRMRAFAVADPAGALAFAQVWGRSDTAADREAAVRGLRWIAGASADGELTRIERGETDKMVLAALRRVRTVRAGQGTP
mgnify:CR=1 FL=1